MGWGVGIDGLGGSVRLGWGGWGWDGGLGGCVGMPERGGACGETCIGLGWIRRVRALCGWVDHEGAGQEGRPSVSAGQGRGSKARTLLLAGMATSTYWSGESESHSAMTGTFTYDASCTDWGGAGMVVVVLRRALLCIAWVGGLEPRATVVTPGHTYTNADRPWSRCVCNTHTHTHTPPHTLTHTHTHAQLTRHRHTHRPPGTPLPTTSPASPCGGPSRRGGAARGIAW